MAKKTTLAKTKRNKKQKSRRTLKQKGGAEKVYPRGDKHKRISYTGELKNGVPHGRGTMIYERSDSYYGNWKDGKRDGQGEMSYHNYRDYNIMDIYKGEWKDDKKEGTGTMKYKTKYYETLPDTFYYEGKWKNDNEHGMGIHRWEYGDYFKTTWEDGEADTRGILKMTLENGDIYEGEVHNYDLGDWQEDFPDGKGKMIYKNGAVYHGKWINGVPQGAATTPDVWTSDADCENSADIEDPISLEKIPEGRGFRLEAEPVKEEIEKEDGTKEELLKGRCYDVASLSKIKGDVTPLTRASFTETDKKRITAYKRLSASSGGKGRKK